MLRYTILGSIAKTTSLKNKSATFYCLLYQACDLGFTCNDSGSHFVKRKSGHGFRTTIKFLVFLIMLDICDYLFYSDA